MTDELTPSLAGPADTEDDKGRRLHSAATAICDAVQPLIDGQVILATDIVVIVQHPDGKVGMSHINTGFDDETKRLASKQAARYHLGELGAPDSTESRTVRVPKKH